MTDFRPDIHINLSFYRGIIEDPDRIESLNTILNELEALGFDKLVQNFSTQRDPERASDILFEISIGQLLRRNLDIQDLQQMPQRCQTWREITGSTMAAYETREVSFSHFYAW